MGRFSQFYIIRLEFLGFRYSGWQKQENVKTVQGMFDKTVKHILKTGDFRSLAASRTDAKVSADDFVVELLCNADLSTKQLKEELNSNIPQDIRIKSVQKTTADFNVLHAPKTKEYHYHFTFGMKPKPSVSPFYGYLGDELNVEKMIQACRLFEGEHNFRNFSGRPDGRKDFTRKIDLCRIENSERLPETYLKNRWKLVVKSKGFMKYQIRLMMAALEQIGKENLEESGLIQMLTSPEDKSYEYVAPGSGLVLHSVEL